MSHLTGHCINIGEGGKEGEFLGWEYVGGRNGVITGGSKCSKDYVQRDLGTEAGDKYLPVHPISGISCQKTPTFT